MGSTGAVEAAGVGDPGGDISGVFKTSIERSSESFQVLFCSLTPFASDSVSGACDFDCNFASIVG